MPTPNSVGLTNLRFGFGCYDQQNQLNVFPPRPDVSLQAAMSSKPILHHGPPQSIPETAPKSGRIRCRTFTFPQSMSTHIHRPTSLRVHEVHTSRGHGVHACPTNRSVLASLIANSTAWRGPCRRTAELRTVLRSWVLGAT